MRPASGPLIALLASGQFAYVDCFTIQLVSGTVLRYTNGQRSVRFIPPGDVTPRTFTAKGVIINGMRMRSVRGVQVDEQDCTISAEPDVLIDGVPFMVALRLGMFDGGIITRDRAYFSSWDEPVVGSLCLFAGRVSIIPSGGDTLAHMKVKSETVVLDIDMPRNAFQMSCKNVLFDSGCKLIKGDWDQTGLAESGTTRQTIVWASAATGTYDLGTITFETGVNVGQSRTIRKSTGTTLILSFPFDYIPAVNDQFKAFPGCDYTRARCAGFFSNEENFRGFPYVPAAETAL